jgi:SOS-response transcriptional repressor LexA
MTKTVRSKRPMTPKMDKLLQFIKNYTKKNNYSPTFSEMANELGYKC